MLYFGLWLCVKVVALGYVATQCTAWYPISGLSAKSITLAHRSARVSHKDLKLSGRHEPLSRLQSGDTSIMLRAAKPQEEDPEGVALISPVLPSLLGALFVCSALLGPFLDGYHGAFDVLEYKDPLPIYLGSVKIVGTAAWVPPLFGVAGIIIGGLYSLLDKLIGTQADKSAPGWPAVFSGISLFSFQYYLSGLLASGDMDPALLTLVLTALAVVQFFVFDRTTVGLIVGLLTAIGGPVIEVVLINFQLYHYTNPDWPGGIPSWIWAVYLAGAPAVGNLSRKLELTLKGNSGEDE